MYGPQITVPPPHVLNHASIDILRIDITGLFTQNKTKKTLIDLDLYPTSLFEI